MYKETFGDNIISFYKYIRTPDVSRFHVEVISPFQASTTQTCTTGFFKKFYNDNKKRVYIIGINPGRFGSGTTGVPFTDAIALEHYCGIKNTIEKRKELTSDFIYRVVKAFGGTKRFFGSFYLTAVSPVGFTKNGKNYNYYDDRKFYDALVPFLVDSIEQQIAFGAKDAVVILGTGKNLKVFTELNNQHGWFKEVHGLPHPRYVMQYKRNSVDSFIKQYLDILNKVLS